MSLRILPFFLPMVLTNLVAQPDAEVRQIIVHYIEPTGLVVSEPIARGMSLQALGARYQVSLEAILAANPDLNPEAVPLGYPLAIPLRAEAINQRLPASSSAALPLSYRVQPKETLYRISKIYLGTTPEALLALNPNASENLAIGQVLHIGWYLPSTGTSGPSAAAPASNPVADMNITDYAAEYVREGAEIREEKGLAVWKSGSTEGHYFVLHPTARVGSYMEVTNPMLHRSVTAKVAGQLTPGLYPKNVGLVVSPSLARALGALDQQFFARWRFVQ